MENETNVSTEINPQNGMTEDYLAVIKEMKANTVSKDDYDKLKEENRNLLQTLVEGKQLETPTEEEQVDVQAICKELKDTSISDSNLSGWTKVLKAREGMIKQGYPDPFIPRGKYYTPSQEMDEAANRVAEVIQDCIDYAEGDSEVFTNELYRRIQDVRY